MSPVITLAASVSLMMTLAAPAASVSSDALQNLSRALVAQGFENVVVSGEPGAPVKVYYENRIYRYELRAMGVVLALLDEGLPEKWAAAVIPMTAGVPVVSVTTTADDYRRFISGEADPDEFAKSLVIHTHPQSPDLKRGENRSFRRLDLSAGPTFSLEFEQFDDSLRGRVNIVPQAEIYPARGLLATGQLIIPLYDEIEERTSGVRPGRATLDVLGRRGGTLGLARAGIFNNERYGFILEAGRWVWGDRVLFRGSGHLTGKLALKEGVWEYSDLEVFTYSLEAKYWYPLIDVTLKASFGRFLAEEYGGRFDLSRAFGELDIGFFVIKTESDSLAGLLVDIPLPLARYSRPKPVRLKTVPHLVWEYRDEVSGTGLMPGGGMSIENLHENLAPVFIRNNVSEWIESRRMI